MSRIDDALDQSIDSLLQDIGRSVRIGATPLGPDGDGRLGRAWLRSQWTRLKESLCGSTAQRALNVNPDSETRIRDIAAVADVLLQPVYRNSGIPVASLAVVLAKHGLDRLCGEETFEG